MSELQILYINILLYVIGHIYFVARFGFLNLAALGMMCYLLGSIMSLLFYITPVYIFTFSNEGQMNVEGMLWLFLFNFLLCNILRYFNFPKAKVISGYNMRLINNIQSGLIVVFSIILVFDMPITLRNILSQNFSDLRELTYTEGALASNFFVISILKRIFGELNLLLLAIALFNILVLRRRKKIDWLSIAIYLLVLLNTMAAYISRSIIVYRLVALVILFVILRPYIKAKYVKHIFVVGIPIVIFLGFFFNSVTSSRFGTGGKGNQAELFANLRYAGEPQINFIGLMYEKTTGLASGYRSFPLYRKAFGLEYFGQEGKDKSDNLVYLDKLHPYPNYILYTAGGDWYMDFGKYIPILFLLLLNFLAFLFRETKNRFNFCQFIIAIVLAYYVVNGIYYAQFQNESGNFLIFFTLLLVIANKNHRRVLLKKFSLGYRKINKKWIRVEKTKIS